MSDETIGIAKLRTANWTKTVSIEMLIARIVALESFAEDHTTFETERNWNVVRIRDPNLPAFPIPEHMKQYLTASALSSQGPVPLSYG